MGCLTVKRSARQLPTLLVMFAVALSQLSAEDRTSASPDRKIRETTPQDSPLVSEFNRNYLRVLHELRNSRIEMPPQPRISRSRLPLRQVKLIGGDQFYAECLDWGSNSVTFRLLNGQILHLPSPAVAVMQNPPGEIDLIDESVEDGQFATEPGAADRLLKNRYDFSPACCARIEFYFYAAITEPNASCGEWQLDWSLNHVKQPPMTVRIGPERRISVTGLSSTNEASSQTLKISDGSHSFIALFTEDHARLILDDVMLASIPAKDAAIDSVQFRLPDPASKNNLRIEDLQVRRLDSAESRNSFNEAFADSDRIELPIGDTLFGRLISLNRKQAMIESFGERQVIPWHEMTALKWRQPEIRVSQMAVPKTGLVTQIQMQPFVDRPECETESWTGTVVRVDATQLHMQHSLAGDLVFRWSEVRRLLPLFYGQSILIDARQVHLGNAIRSDLHRPMPEGTDLQRVFRLNEIPTGKSYLSCNLAELEAAGADAPPGSPFLTELRAGHLVTELLVNDQKIGTLNSMIQYKANSLRPDRIRMEIPHSVLKPGLNSLRLRQLPLKPGGREYDDCELDDLRLELEIR